MKNKIEDLILVLLGNGWKIENKSGGKVCISIFLYLETAE